MAETFEQLFYSILHDTIDLQALHSAGVPSSLTALIAGCTAKDPAQRPQNFSTICTELNRELEARDVAAPQTNRRLLDVLRSKRWILAGVLLVLAVIALYLRPQPVPDRLNTPTGEMILIPQGEFLSGSSQTRETLPAFYIDRFEVTNAAYGEFCLNTGKELPPGFAEAPKDFPVVNITIDDARQFARWAGKRLPTRKEWEKAARGSDGRAYPWGNDADAALANVSAESLASVTSFPTSDSPLGIRQMVGNAWEFVDELSTPSSTAVANFAELLLPAPTENEAWYLIMGGSYRQPLLPGAAYDTAFVPARFHSASIGFRCVKDAR